MSTPEGDETMMEEDDDDEYETDSDAEEGDYDEEEESDEEGEEEQWSLRVRLLSAVDLPPSLSPNVPLCPWFKFGLVEDINAALDQVAEDKKRAIEEARRESEKRKKRTLVPKSADEGGSDGEDSENLNRRSSSSGDPNAQMNTTSRLLSTLTPCDTRTSTSKIMSRNANGGGGNGADWNEEYRWNDLGSPMEGCLLVRLSTRLAPETGISGAPSISNTMGMSQSMDYGDASSDGGSGHFLQSEEEAGISSGIRGLWRKGREQLEEHRRRSTVAGPREERAAAVAQFLMRGGNPDDATAATAGTEGSASQHSGGLNQQDLVEYQQKWAAQKGGGEHGQGLDMQQHGAVRTSEIDEDTHNAEGLCLGTLTIPLSRLPLEDAFIGNKAAVVEKWYQLEDPNPSSKRDSSGLSEGGPDGGDGLPSGMDDGEPSLLHGPRRSPSVLLEITFASSDYLDESEDDAHNWDNDQPLDLTINLGNEEKEDAPQTPKREEKKEEKQEEKKKEPELEPGIVDFVCVVGARDIGNQRNDDGSKGWVQSTPECCVLERYPPTDEFHINNGRNTGLIPQVEWFCFPEGCKLWRGPEAPRYADLRAGGVSTLTNNAGDGNDSGFSASKFDKELGTTSSFSWFVLSSNSDVYGSRLVKTYGTIIRFYVPAPPGIDPTQDDFAQTVMGPGINKQKEKGGGNKKRLWVPIGICITTTLPIVGVVEEILLRMCGALASRLDDSSTEVMTSTSNDSSSSSVSSRLYTMLQTDLYHLIVNYSRPMDGVVHSSIPFLEGERLHVTTCPLNGLPPLPHGGAVAAACRLLGAEGLTLLLAAALTECRILIHSVNVANVAMVAEVITALIFPFTWQLPFIPVLPKDMLEILDAPLPFFVGVPTHSLQLVEKSVLTEIVVVDLDDVSSFTEYDARRGPRTKIPPALPASVSTSISKAVFRLLKEEDELEHETEMAFVFPGLRRSPRLEAESLPERMFRVHVALQICSLVRGYQECLFFVSALQPVFNRDRFLRQAPALFEDKRPTVLVEKNFSDRSQRILSPRSKRFLSVLVNSQHFHQLLERLSSEETAFFHEVMEAIEGQDDPSSSTNKGYVTTSFGSTACDEAAQKLFESLEKIEQSIPTYVVNRPSKKRRNPNIPWTWDDDDDEDFKIDSYVETDEPFWLLPEEKKRTVSFTHGVLRPIMADKTNDPAASSEGEGVHALSLEYLVELEKNPWRYGNMLELMNTEQEGNDSAKAQQEGNTQEAQSKTTIKLLPRVTLREALGERRFKAWKIANDHSDEDDIKAASPAPGEQSDNDGFDLSSILLSVPDLPALDGSKPSGYETNQPRADANDREKVRRCLELAFGSSQDSMNFEENGRDLISEAELALRNNSAQRYLFSVLNESVQRRNKLTDSKQRGTRTSTAGGQQSVSRLEPSAFECIVRLCYAVLEACSVEADYESAYRLLTFTGGFCTTTNVTGGPIGAGGEQKTVYMTERISIHPVFSDLRLWERVLLLHQQDQQQNKEEEEEEAANEAEDDVDNQGEEESTGEDNNVDNSDNDAYDNVVTTLYEMVGYNVPAEEVSRFATRISEEKGWFSTEKGQALLVLARRLTAKRDEGDAEKAGGAGAAAGDFTSFLRKESKDVTGGGVIVGNDTILESEEIAWNHPSTCLVSYERQGGARAFLGNMLGATDSQIGTSSSHGLHKNSSHGYSSHGLRRSSSSKRGILDANSGDYAGRVAITAMASFGGSAIVTGGIDGSVFLAHTINFGQGNKEDSNCPAAESTCPSPLHSNTRLVNGVQLQWGGKGGDVDAQVLSGSVTCIAASKGSGYRFGGADKSSSKPGSDGSCPDEDEIVSSMDGCQIIAGTTGGSLRAWSLKSVYHSFCQLNRENSPAPASPTMNRSHHGSGATSVRISGTDDHGMQEAVAGAPIGGHRGGVSCVDLPPSLYFPDSLVSGGEDGLIKLWSLKSPSSDQDGGGAQQKGSIQSRFFNSARPITGITDFDASDAQSVLTGHEGRIICVKTAWHGDALLSGGADKTVRLWDCSGGGGKALTTLRGHQAMVTQTHFWGPNTIVSASTDRSIHLWDTRVSSSPLFVLRYHLSPVSDLLLGNRSEPLMVSAGADGSLATWDFRVLSSGAQAKSQPSPEENAEDRPQSSRTIRTPMATMNHTAQSKSTTNCGSVRLARAIARDDFSFFSVGDDGVVNEWEATHGGRVSGHETGHLDAVSGFCAFASADGLVSRNKGGSSRSGTVGGTITCSWDGTVRLRRLSRKKSAR